jgi:hypothetical protein
MESQLRLLVDQFAQNPAQAGKSMRDLLAYDSMEFATHGMELLKATPMGPGSNYIFTLLLRDPSILQRLDPRFDIRVFKQLAGSGSPADQLEPAIAERLLEVMSAFSDDSRTMPVLMQLLKHPSPRIRSKAVLIAGRDRSDAKLTGTHLREKDSRIRANAIESLWGNTTPEAKAIMLAATADPDNRAAANAVLGLYKLDDTQSITLVLEMSEHLSPIFRCSAIWVMSQTKDPRFLKLLAKLIGDRDATVRNQAFHAVAKIRNNKALLLTGPKLRVFAKQVDGRVETRRKLRVLICTEDGEPVEGISGVQFALDENKRGVAEYSVLTPSEPLVVGVVLPLKDCEASLQTSLKSKRANDRWAILTYIAGESADAAVPVKFSVDPTVLSGAASLTGAAQAVLAEITKESGRRHLVLIDGPNSGQSAPDAAEVDNLLLLAKSGSVQVHALITAPINPNLQKLCEGSGGSMIKINGAEEIAGALEVLNSYELTYVPTSPGSSSQLSIQVYSAHGCGEQTLEIGRVSEPRP